MNSKFIFLNFSNFNIFWLLLLILVVCFVNSCLVFKLKTFFSKELNSQPSCLKFYLDRLDFLIRAILFILVFLLTFFQISLFYHDQHFPQFFFYFMPMFYFSARWDLTFSIFSSITENCFRSETFQKDYFNQYCSDFRELNKLYSSYLNVAPSFSFWSLLFVLLLGFLIHKFLLRSVRFIFRSQIVLCVSINLGIKFYFPVFFVICYFVVRFFLKNYFIFWFLFYLNSLNLAQKIKFLQGLYYLILVNFVLNFVLWLVFFVLLFYFGIISSVGLANLSDVSQNLLDLIHDLTQATIELYQISKDDHLKCEHLENLLARLRVLEENQTFLKEAAQFEFKKNYVYFPYRYFTIARQILLCFFGLSWVVFYAYVKRK